jgi:hypothetical protein
MPTKTAAKELSNVKGAWRWVSFYVSANVVMGSCLVGRKWKKAG